MEAWFSDPTTRAFIVMDAIRKGIGTLNPTLSDASTAYSHIPSSVPIALLLNICIEHDSITLWKLLIFIITLI